MSPSPLAPFVEACIGLGRGFMEIRQAIKELETPRPEVISAYAKFAGDNSAMERAAKAREKAGFLRGLLDEISAKSR